MFVSCKNCIADRVRRMNINRSIGNKSGTYTVVILKGNSDIDHLIAREKQHLCCDWVDEVARDEKILSHLRKTQQKVRVFDTDDWNEVISGEWKDVLLPIWKPEV